LKLDEEVSFFRFMTGKMRPAAALFAADAWFLGAFIGLKYARTALTIDRGRLPDGNPQVSDLDVQRVAPIYSADRNLYAVS
jgi:hypothetical protein